MEEEKKDDTIIVLKRKTITNKFLTFLLMAILICAFVGLNLLVYKKDLPKIDVTENQLYTLSELSKEEIKEIDQKVSIYVYGYKENDSLIDLLKQYSRENSQISYEIITEENNNNKIIEYELSSEYPYVIIEVNGKHTKLNGEYDFVTYDYITGQRTDLTEQKITNSILNLVLEKKPKVYFITGHEEIKLENMTSITKLLENEIYSYETINLLNVDRIPEDCDVLAIISPNKDFSDIETTKVLEYINNGGNIIYTKDTDLKKTDYKNIQRILDCYGVEIVNGYVYETDSNYMVASYPAIISPRIESINEITNDIYTDGGYLVMPNAQKICKKENEELNVEYQTLLASTEKAYYIEDVEENISTALSNSKVEKNDVALLAIKTIGNEEENNFSKLIIVGNGMFVEDVLIEAINKVYPISYLGNNCDFFLNSVASLTDREDIISIRKPMGSATYVPTKVENTIVKLIIFLIPLIIFLIGIIIWKIRKKRG